MRGRRIASPVIVGIRCPAEDDLVRERLRMLGYIE
jgi:hypothetical protein